MTKRYIEDVLPLGELNKYAQKGGGIGSLNAMHPYFARRPLTASRAMTLAALMEAPSTDSERKAFERLLVELSNEEWPDKPELLEKAQQLIRKTHGGRTPRVLDPFAGGGSMSLEAMRLGCEATALDLNPVAYLSLIASLVYPQEFGQNLDELDGARGDAENSAEKQLHANGTLPGINNSTQSQTLPLVEDVRHWAEYVMMQAQAEIGDCYTSADSDGAIPVTYLWAKTIICPHCGGETPLIKRRWLQKKEGTEPIAYSLSVDKEAKTYAVEILRGEAAIQSEPDRGTMRGATVECIYCDTPSERDRIVEQGQTGNIGQHMLAVVLYREGDTGRDFRCVGDADRDAYDRAARRLERLKSESYEFWGFERLLAVVPDEPTPPERSRATAIRQYGVTEWAHMFNDRQLLASIVFGQQIRAVRELLGTEYDAYSRALALYLGFVLAKQVVYNSKGAWWQPGGLKTAPVMARHDIPITWDYAEANPFSGQATSWESFINSLWRSIHNTAMVKGPSVAVRLGSATQLPSDWTGYFDAVITDPPYYDSVNYGDLSDYFYPWHKRVVGDDYPEAFVTEITPKDEEIIQDVYHGGTKAAAKQFYEDEMAKAFLEMHRVLRDDGISVVMFAHKKSSAWETLISALIRAGFQITASWPLNTEGRRLQSYRAVTLASSVYLICRKRFGTQKIGYLEDMEADLRLVIRRYLEQFWAAGIGGADFFMSAIGPGLSVYSRYARVERYDGTQVGVSDFLDLVRHETASFAIERIIGERGFSERLDTPTQFYVLWRWGYNDWDVPDGEALLLSTAVGIELNVLMDRIGLVDKVKSKLRLLGPAARVERLDKTVERVVAGGAVPLVDVIHKACLLWQKDRQEDLSALVAARGGEMWPVAQAVAELLPRDNPQRKALESMLGTRMDLESRARQWAETYQPSARVEQLKLWE